VFAMPSSNLAYMSSYGGGGYVVEKVFGVVVRGHFTPGNVLRRGWFFSCDLLSKTQCIRTPQRPGLI